MNLQIGMDDSGRYVFDRDKLPDDVEPYAEGFVCPPEAIVRDGFKSAKDAWAFIRKSGGDDGGGEVAFVWKRVKNRDGATEHHMLIGERHMATVTRATRPIRPGPSGMSSRAKKTPDTNPAPMQRSPPNVSWMARGDSSSAGPYRPRTGSANASEMENR